MTKKRFIKVLGLLLVVGLLFAALPSGQAQAATSTIACTGTGDSALLQGAINAAADGDTISVTGTCVLDSNITVSKAVTLDGNDKAATIQVSGTGYRITMTTAGATLQGFEIEKTDKTGEQNIIWINASNVTIANNKVHGQFVIGDGEVARAIVISGGNSGLLITGNEFYGLRQPAYISGVTTGIISNNYTHGTKGWVLEQGDMTFTGNTWGTVALGNPNVYDIAILSGVNAAYYTDVPAMSGANNNAFIEDQRYSPARLTPVYVNASAPACTDCGTARMPYQTIQAGIDRAIAGGTVHVAAGTYTEQAEITKDIKLVGAGVDTTTIKAPATLPVASDARSAIVLVHGAGVEAEISGFSISGPGPSGCGSIRAGVYVYDSAYLNLHDNKLVDIRDSGATISGCQNGVAISVGRAAWSTSGTATIEDNLIVDYQKGAIVVDNTGSDAVITGNTITGAGTTSITAQNGIQISRGATATISGNTVSGNSFHLDGSDWDWGATGVLLYQAGNVAFTGGNNFAGNDSHVYISEAGMVTMGAETFGASSAPVDNGYYVINYNDAPLDLTQATFPTTDPFELAVRIWDGIDEAGNGLARFEAGHVYVNAGGSIQRAIDLATAGDVIEVADGTYNYDTEGHPADKGLIKITKPVTLKAVADGNETRPIINASGAGGLTNDGVFKIQATQFQDGLVVIEGFDITGIPQTGIAITAPMYQVPGHENTIIIRDNLIHGMIGAVDFWGTTTFVTNPDPANAVVSHVEISGNKIYDMGVAGVEQGLGVMIEDPKSNPDTAVFAAKITNNEFYNFVAKNETNPSAGIVLPRADAANGEDLDVLIQDNKFGAGVNVDVGIQAGAAVTGPVIIENDFSNGGVGVYSVITAPVSGSPNWWGSASGPVAGQYVGTVSYDPWCGDAACTFLVSATEPAVSGFYVQDGKLILKGGINVTGGIVINEPLYILLKDGTVIQNSSPCFIVNSSNVTITTESIGGAKCVPTAGANGIDVAADLNNITIEGIDFDGTGQTTGDGIHFAGAIQDFVLVDNYMHDLDSDGIEFAGNVSEVVNIQGNMFKANGGLGINNLGASTVGAEYNSWGDVAGPTGTNGDGVSAKVTYEPFTHADLYLVSSGTPWANQVVKGQQITYTVMAHLVNVNAADFVLTYPAELTWVSSDASGSMGTESVLHNATARTLQFIGYNTTNLSGDLPLFTVTFTGSTAVANTPLSFSYGTTSGFGMAGYESSNNVYVNAMVNGSVTVIDLPTISSTDIQGYYLTGEQREFHVTVDNLLTGGNYAHVIFQFNVTADAGDLSLEYWTGSAWAPLPLTCASGVCSGYYGPALGFAMPNPYNATSLFRATAAVPGAYPVEVKLLDLDTNPDTVLATYTNTAYVYDKATVTVATTDQYLIVGEPGAFTVTINNPTTGRNYDNSVVFDILIPSHAVSDFSALSCSITSPAPFTWDLLSSLVPDGAGGVKARIVGLDGYFEVPPTGFDMVLNCSVTVTTAGAYGASGNMVDVVNKVTPVERIVSDSVSLSTVAYLKPVITPTNLGGPFDAGVPETVSLSIANASIPEPFEVVFNYPAGTVIVYNGVTYTCAATCPVIPVDLTAEPTVLEFTVTFDEAWTGDVSVSLYDSDWTPADRLLASASATNVVVSGGFAVTGTFSMQGNASRAGIPVTLTWGGTLVTYGPSANTTSAISNNFSLSVLYGGEYTITTLQPRYLNVTADLLKKITVAGPYNMSALLLRGGNAYWRVSDTVLDNIINSGDSSIVGTQYGSSGADAGFGNHGDCNFDGIVNIQDLALVGGNWSLTSLAAYSGTLPWVP